MSFSRSEYKTLGLLLCILLLLGLYTSITTYQRTSKAEYASKPATGSLVSVEGLPYTDLDGNPVDLSTHDGKIRVVKVWASWVPASAEELMDLTAVAKEFGTDMVALAINRNEPARTVIAYLATVGELETVHVILDPTDHFYKSTNGYTMPQTVIYDRNGEVITHTHGRLNEEQMRAYIQQAL